MLVVVLFCGICTAVVFIAVHQRRAKAMQRKRYVYNMRLLLVFHLHYYPDAGMSVLHSNTSTLSPVRVSTCCFFRKEGIFVIMQLPKLSQTIHTTKLECLNVIMTTTWSVYSCNFIVYFIMQQALCCSKYLLSYWCVCVLMRE